MHHNRSMGVRGELLAQRFLEEKGYRIRAVNWRHRRTEVDIIAEQDGCIIFVEVKTRVNNRFGHPEEAVHAAKQKRLCQAAEAYLQEHNIRTAIRFDIISILVNKSPPEIYHIEDAFFGYDG